MGLKVINSLIKTVAKKAYVAPKTELQTLESLGLKMEQLSGDVINISKGAIRKPSAEKLEGLIKKAKLRTDTVFDSAGKNILEAEYGAEDGYEFYTYINDNNSMFLERLIELFPLKPGEKVNMAVQKRMIYLKDISHSNYTDKEFFLKNFLSEVNEIEASVGKDGKLLYNDTLANIMSKKAILQAKYNDPERYKELQDLLSLYRQGKVSQYTVKTFFPNAHFHSLVKSDMQKLLAGESYYPQLMKLTDDAIAKLEIGEAFSVGKEMFVKTAKGYEKLKIDAQTYERLFPGIERYAPAQGDVGNCGKISTWNALIKNPRSRIELYKMFEQTPNGVRVTIPRLNSSKEFNWVDLVMLNTSQNMKGCTGHKMLEYSYDKIKTGAIETSGGSRDEMVLDILGPKGESALTTLSLGNERGVVTLRDGIFITMPDVVDPDSGKVAEHIYSMSRDGFQNPWTGIEVINGNMSKAKIFGGEGNSSLYFFD